MGHLRTTTAARRTCHAAVTRRFQEDSATTTCDQGTICGEVVVKLIVFEALINRRKLQCILSFTDLQPNRKTVSLVKDLLFPRGQVHPVHRVLDKLLDLARCQGGRCSLLEHKST